MNRNKKQNRFFLILTTLLLSLAGSGCVFNQRASSVNSCSIDMLLITESKLPENVWQSDGAPSADQAPSRVRAEKIGISFYTSSQGGIGQKVYRFGDVNDAIKYYEEDISGWYTQQKHESEWLTPDDFLDLHIAADIHDLRCSNSLYTGAETCRYFARYDSYVIEMSATTLAIEHDQLVRLIIDIDQNMMNCLNNNR